MFSCSNAVILSLVLASCFNVWVWHATVAVLHDADCDSCARALKDIQKRDNKNVDLDVIVTQLIELDQKIDLLHVRLGENILAQAPQVVINATQPERCNNNVQQAALLDLVAAEFNKILRAAGSAFACARLAGSLTISAVWQIACKAVRVFGPGVALIVVVGIVLRPAGQQ